MMSGVEVDASVESLHARHYDDLVRLAALVLGNRHSAEEVVQEAFARVLRSWSRIEDPDRRLSYVRSTVLNGARNRLARRRTAARFVPWRDHPAEGVEDVVLANDRHTRVLAEVRRLPARQRECLILRFYAELSEREIADTLDISPGSVKTHIHRALRAVAARIGEDV